MKQPAYEGLSTSRRNPRLLITLLWILSALILVMVGIAAGSQGKAGSPFPRSGITVLENGWSDETGASVSLPIKVPCRTNGYRFSTALPSGNIDGQSLLFSAKYLNVHLYIDEKELGSCLCQPTEQDRTLGKTFVLLPLPDESSARTLRIEAEPLLGENAVYEITAPSVGTEGALVYELIVSELPLLGISFMIFCFGLLLLICDLQALRAGTASGEMGTLRNGFRNSFLSMGLFAILFSLYSLAITDTIHLFLANSYLIYLMEFLLLALLPLPLLVLVAEACTAAFQTLLFADCCATFLNFVLQAGLHFFFRLELRDTLPITHLLMVVTAALLIAALASILFQDRGQWWLPISFIPVLAGALFDLLRYYLPGFYQKALGFQLGVLVFLLLQTTDLIRRNFAFFQNNLKVSSYRQMAYTDALTGLANRTAFEAMLEKIRKEADGCSSIWCISADINNLKKTNDALGHAAGDELIWSAAQILRYSFGENAHIYRTGGDEFVLFLFNQPEKVILSLYERLDAAQKQYNDSHEHSLSIALGCDQFQFSQDDTIAKLLSRVDALMYEDKRKWKEEKGNAFS